MKKQSTYLISAIAFLTVLFISCKKYPENNLWFRNPNTVIVRNWNLESFTVDGTDSTNYDELKMYTDKGLNFQDQSIVYPEQFEATWSLDKKKKNITINTTNSGNFPSYVTQNNIFRSGVTWKIEKLTKNQFWLSGARDGKNYAIHFK